MTEKVFFNFQLDVLFGLESMFGYTKSCLCAAFPTVVLQNLFEASLNIIEYQEVSMNINVWVYQALSVRRTKDVFQENSEVSFLNNKILFYP